MILGIMWWGWVMFLAYSISLALGCIKATGALLGTGKKHDIEEKFTMVIKPKERK